MRRRFSTISMFSALLFSRRSAAAALALALATTLAGVPAAKADTSLLEQWREGLTGARLTSYTGSVLSTQSSLRVLELCRSGRFRLSTDAGWTLPGQAGGASKSVVTGSWGVEQRGAQIVVTYRSDEGQRGAYPAYLQANGRVNLGGAAYAVERGAAGC